MRAPKSQRFATVEVTFSGEGTDDMGEGIPLLSLSRIVCGDTINVERFGGPLKGTACSAGYAVRTSCRGLLAPEFRHEEDNDGVDFQPSQNHAEGQDPLGRIRHPGEIIRGPHPADARTDVADTGQ